MTEGRKDGMTESLTGPLTKTVEFDRVTLKITVKAPDLGFFMESVERHKNQIGLDALIITTGDKLTAEIGGVSFGEAKNFQLTFPTIFAPGDSPGRLRCIIAGKSIEIELPDLDPTIWESWAGKLTKRNLALGLTVPPVQPGQLLIPSDNYIKTPQGFVPFHKLAARNPAGLPLFPEESERFRELRTPLNWAVGLALFSYTSAINPGDWQEARLADLEKRVFTLSPRRGDHRTDALAEIIKLFAEPVAVAFFTWEKKGRFWYRRLDLKSFRILAEIGFSYIEKTSGRRVRPDDPAFREIAHPLKINGRRLYAPNGKDVKTLPGDRFRLDRISWRWTPSFVDDLKAEPALDAKGRIKKDARGRVLRTGYYIQTASCIFRALAILRAERAYLANDLLILLAHDIKRPGGEKRTAAERNVIERETGRLFDLLGMEKDPKHPGRREEQIAQAIFRLKQPDIGALLIGSDERPRKPSRAEMASGRRKGSYYRLIRSPDYTPPAALVTKDEAAKLEANIPSPVISAKPAQDQTIIPGLEMPPIAPIPTGAEIRAAREAAGINLRAFAREIAGPCFSTWSVYETGKPIRAKSISPAVWDRVRAFIKKHPAPIDSGGQGGKP